MFIATASAFRTVILVYILWGQNVALWIQDIRRIEIVIRKVEIQEYQEKMQIKSRLGDGNFISSVTIYKWLRSKLDQNKKSVFKQSVFLVVFQRPWHRHWLAACPSCFPILLFFFKSVRHHWIERSLIDTINKNQQNLQQLSIKST